MPKRLFTAAAAALLLTGAQGLAATSPFTAIYSFGDSLSDAGNLYLLSLNPANGIAHQPLLPYSNGRFSNGNVWTQDLANALGLGPLNPSLSPLGGNDYAYGGATTGTTDIHTATFIDLPSQIGQFESAHPLGASPTALYTLWIGANDVFGALGALKAGEIDKTEAVKVVGEAAQNEANAASTLSLLGAKDLLVFDLPNLGLTPSYNTSPQQGEASTLAALYNRDLTADLGSVTGLKIFTADTYFYLGYVVGHKGEFGFTNATDACWTGNDTGGAGTLCGTTMAEQDQYLFWDDVHPTAAGHVLLSNLALSALGVSVPEPSTWAMLALGFAGLAAFQTRKARAVATAL